MFSSSYSFIDSLYPYSGFRPTKSCIHSSRNNTCPVTKSINKDDGMMDDYFKIVIILDESGSMSDIKEKMIKSINDLIKEQKQVKERPSTFTLVKFNDKINRVVKNRLLENVQLLNEGDYTPSGSTALYDAIGDTIKWFENEKDVLMVIVTDGMNNASTRYNKSMISSMIENKKKYNNWTYVYLSCDLNTELQGNDLGFATSSYATNYNTDQMNFGGFLGKNLNSAITNYRKMGLSVQKQLK